MKKLIIIIVVVVALALIGAGIFFLINQNNSTGGSGGTGTTGTLPPVSTSTINSTGTVPSTAPTGATFALGTSQGTVTVNNFYKTSPFITQDQLTVEVTSTPQYEIDYYAGDSSFIISINSMPFEASREAAEAELLSSLGISQADACKLSVYEGVPAGVLGSDQYVGKQYPLSFCN